MKSWMITLMLFTSLGAGASQVGSTICKIGTLSYTYIVMTSVSGHEYTEQRQKRMQLVASLEELSSDGTMLRFRMVQLNNVGDANYQFSYSRKHPLYFDEFLYRPGQAFWDKAAQWYSCGPN